MPLSPPEPPRLLRPMALPDMLLYRLNGIRARGGGIVLRLCEGRFGVTRREWVLLALLHAFGPLHSSALADRAGLERSATSKAVVSMVRKGLVGRRPRAGDQRYAELALSPAGSDLYGRMKPVMEGINARILSVLDAAEIAVLDDLLDRLQESVDTLAAGAAPWPHADGRRGRRKASDSDEAARG